MYIHCYTYTLLYTSILLLYCILSASVRHSKYLPSYLNFNTTDTHTLYRITSSNRTTFFRPGWKLETATTARTHQTCTWRSRLPVRYDTLLCTMLLSTPCLPVYVSYYYCYIQLQLFFLLNRELVVQILTVVPGGGYSLTCSELQRDHQAQVDTTDYRWLWYKFIMSGDPCDDPTAAAAVACCRSIYAKPVVLSVCSLYTAGSTQPAHVTPETKQEYILPEIDLHYYFLWNFEELGTSISKIV